MSVSTERSTAVRDVAERAAAYAMPGVVVDGNSFAAVAEAAFAAADRARAGDGPSLVECKTYRTRGHSRSDRNRYRAKEEIEAWRARDPIALFESELLGLGLFDRAELDAVAAFAEKEMEEAVAFAEASPVPSPADLTQNVYTEAPR
jgi:pyruvate dehydrogenase E1 component alpha subunit